MKEDKKDKIVGFNILENECIWTKAGVVAFKRCSNAYDCNTCRFDKAMSLATQSRDNKQPARPTLQQALGKRSGSNRQCRHMLTGRVEYKLCDNAYDCKTCGYDQMLDYEDDVRPTGLVPLSELLGYSFAENYYYHDGHTWARVEFGGRVRIGVDDFAMRLLGRPDKWECPEIGKKLMQGQSAFALERKSNRADFLSPVQGTVIVVNQEMMREPARTHSAPFTEGWLILVEPERLKKSLEVLHFGPEGKNWLISEAQRLHEMTTHEYGRLAAAGAMPVDDVFSEAPEVGWENLVKSFLGTGC